MAFRNCVVTFSLFFVCFHCLNKWALAGSQIVVDIRNDLPEKTEAQLELGCAKGFFYLQTGNRFNQTLPEDQYLSCTALWTPSFNTWDVYVPKTDKGHNTVYWSVRKDGFYRSWDGSNWDLEFYWRTL